MLRRFPGVVVELRTARANGVPHSTIRFGRNPRKWTTKDRLLAIALTIHEDGLCSGCGQPVDRSWNEDMAGEYKAHRRLCQGCQAAHLEQDRNGPLKAAEHLWVSDDSAPGFVPDPRLMPTD